MTSGQQLRHSIYRLRLVRACQKEGAADHPYVRVYDSELKHLDRVLDGLSERLDAAGVPKASYTVKVAV